MERKLGSVFEHTWPNPQGACVVVSAARSNLSANMGLQVYQPNRHPGAIVWK
jgi:hypothetical protein